MLIWLRRREARVEQVRRTLLTISSRTFPSDLAPRGIVGTCVCSAVIGFVYLLALLFAIPDVSAFVKSSTNSDQSINLAAATYQLALPQRGALALTILLILNLYFAGMSSLTVTSRIGFVRITFTIARYSSAFRFAMARDGVFPFSRYLRWVYKRTQTPLANVIFVFVIDCLLLLLQLASNTAFAAIIAIATLGFQTSYLMPILFRWTAARKTFPVGEFNLGRFGVPVALIASLWLTITSIFMFFPANYPVTKDNMNYAVVIIAGILAIAAIYWIVSARHWFVGPKRTDGDDNTSASSGAPKTNKSPDPQYNIVSSRF